MAFHRYLLPAAALLSVAGQASATSVGEPVVDRLAPDRIRVTWQDADPVDIFLAYRRDASAAASRRVSHDDRDGREEIVVRRDARPYLMLRDMKTGQVVHVAERLLPLERGSNFRDIGGYPAADGKHVRWGMIYRSGATPSLSDRDIAYIRSIGLKTMVDLRSNEERQIAPSRLIGNGVRYIAVDYPGGPLFSQVTAPGGMSKPVRSVYRDWPTSLAPQFRDIFQRLLAGDTIEYNCSAGQDRTGVATALVLSALGVPRAVIYRDYLLSTQYRRPANELPQVDPARYPGNSVAPILAKMQAMPGMLTPKPLYLADGRPQLAEAFDEIEARWGSVDAYLQKELGIGPVERARLRQLYLE